MVRSQERFPFILFFHLAWENDYGSFRPKRSPLSLPPSIFLSVTFLLVGFVLPVPRTSPLESRRAFGPRGLLICLPIDPHDFARGCTREREKERESAASRGGTAPHARRAALHRAIYFLKASSVCAPSSRAPTTLLSGSLRRGYLRTRRTRAGGPPPYSSLSLTTGHLHRESMGLPRCLNNLAPRIIPGRLCVRLVPVAPACPEFA